MDCGRRLLWRCCEDVSENTIDGITLTNSKLLSPTSRLATNDVDSKKDAT
jgi:hypothetical protein